MITKNSIKTFFNKYDFYLKLTILIMIVLIVGIGSVVFGMERNKADSIPDENLQATKTIYREIRSLNSTLKLLIKEGKIDSLQELNSQVFKIINYIDSVNYHIEANLDSINSELIKINTKQYLFSDSIKLLTTIFIAIVTIAIFFLGFLLRIQNEKELEAQQIAFLKETSELKNKITSQKELSEKFENEINNKIENELEGLQQFANRIEVTFEEERKGFSGKIHKIESRVDRAMSDLASGKSNHFGAAIWGTRFLSNAYKYIDYANTGPNDFVTKRIDTVLEHVKALENYDKIMNRFVDEFIENINDALRIEEREEICEKLELIKVEFNKFIWSNADAAEDDAAEDDAAEDDAAEDDAAED